MIDHPEPLVDANATPTCERRRALGHSLERIPKEQLVPSATGADQYDANGAGFIASFVHAVLRPTVHGPSVVRGPG